MISRDQFRKAFIEEIRNELLKDNHVVIDGLGLFSKKHNPAEEENQPDGTILLHPPKDTLEFDPKYKVKATERFTLINKLSDSLNIHVDILKGHLNDILSDVNALMPGEEVRFDGWGIFRKDKKTLFYIPDPVFQLEINYEFAGQQPIVLLEGSGIFFAGGDDPKGDRPTESGEFIILDKDAEPKKKSEYDALIDEFHTDVRSENTPEKDSEEEFSTDVIQVIPEKNTIKTIYQTQSENDESLPELKSQKDNEENIMTHDDNKGKAPSDSEINKKKSTSSGDLRNLDELNQFSNEDEKASDELAIEFTTLLKKMRDKAKLVAEQEPIKTTDEDDDIDEIPGYNPGIDQPEVIEVSQEKKEIAEEIVAKKEEKSEPVVLPTPKQESATEQKNVVDSTPKSEEKVEHKVEEEPLPQIKIPTKTELQPKEPQTESPKIEESFIPSLKKIEKKEENEPVLLVKKDIQEKPVHDQDDRALPSLKTVKKDEPKPKKVEVPSERKDKKVDKSSKNSSQKRRRRPDLSYAGMIIVIILLIVVLAVGAYFAGFFNRTETFDPFFTDQTRVEDPIFNRDNDTTPTQPVERTPEVQEETQIDEPVRPATPTVTSTNFGLRGSFDMNNRDFSGIIVASLSEEATARRTASNLTSLGFRAHHYNLVLPNGRSTWRVVAGQFENHEDATQAALQLPEPYRNNYFVTNVKL